MAGDTFDGPTGFLSGDHGTQNNFFQGAPRASWPHQVGVMPSRAECFQDRAEAARLRRALAGGGTAVVGPAVRTPAVQAPAVQTPAGRVSAGAVLAGGVLAGLGGVGKTQLAADYARTAWSAGEVDVLVWLTAGTRSAVVDAYAQAAAEVLGAGVENPEEAARVFLAWLEPKAVAEQCRWLVVLDDVTDPAALAGLWPPLSPHGRTLATTRRRDAALTGRGRRRIDVGEFTPAEAADYLTAALAAHDRTEPADHVAALAADLGCLPLALSQAAAYLIDAGRTCAAYRTMLADRARTLAELSPDVLPDDQNHTMAAAWSLSVEYADALRPAGLARPMLQLAAFLAPNGIPANVLTSPPVLDHLATHRPAGAPPPTPEDADGALRALHRLSLVHAPTPGDPGDPGEPGDPGGAVRIHQIVQRATRDALAPAKYDATARAAADALTSVWPEIERDTALSQALRACATALAACAEAALYQPDVHPVLFRAGRSLGQSGQVFAAFAYFEHLVASTGHHLGSDHLITHLARANLADWQGEAGDAAGAAAATAGLLADQERILGADHPATHASRNNLAYWRGEAGDAAGAAAAFAELLDHRLRLLGPDHPDTLAVQNNLARLRGQAGDAAGAAAAFAELLDHVVRVLGRDHPATLTTRGNLAGWRGEAGDAPGAESAFAELLADRERVLGPDHPDTLTTRANLAYWRGQAGGSADAVAANAALLADHERVLGPDHPDTLNTRILLAHWRGEAGDAPGAESAFAELLADRERVLGPDHPDTLTTRANLAHWRGESGDAPGAESAFAEVLADRERVLGPEHPGTLNTRANLAHWRGKAGHAAGAVRDFVELLADYERVLGPEHSGTLNTRANLAHWRGRAGDAPGAAAAFAELLADRERVLGPHHPDTLNTRHGLAHWQARSAAAPRTLD